jgi:hypothetical protein
MLRTTLSMSLKTPNTFLRIARLSKSIKRLFIDSLMMSAWCYAYVPRMIQYWIILLVEAAWKYILRYICRQWHWDIWSFQNTNQVTKAGEASSKILIFRYHAYTMLELAQNEIRSMLLISDGSSDDSDLSSDGRFSGASSVVVVEVVIFVVFFFLYLFFFCG